MVLREHWWARLPALDLHAAHFGIADARLRDDRYGAAIEGLRRSPDAAGLLELGREVLDLDDDALDHFRDDWLAAGGYWPGIEPERIVAAIHDGFLEAMVAARRRGLPLAAVWVQVDPECSGDFFEVTFTEGPGEVTVVIATSAPVRDAASTP